MAFDNDDILDDNDDDDLKQDPVSQMDMQVSINQFQISAPANDFILKGHLVAFLQECASHNTNGFAANVGQLSADEMMVVHQAVGQM